MQNSLERIFAGMAASLHDVVRPAVTDPYARSQVEASAEMLRNLATRVEWRCDDLAAVVDRVRGVLAEAVGAAPDADDLRAARELLDAPAPDRADNAALVRAGTAHLAALAQVQTWAVVGEAGGDQAAARVHRLTREFATWHLDRELERLRS